jgi:hypothetical protein
VDLVENDAIAATSALLVVVIALTQATFEGDVWFAPSIQAVFNPVTGLAETLSASANLPAGFVQLAIIAVWSWLGSRPRVAVTAVASFAGLVRRQGDSPADI